MEMNLGSVQTNRVKLGHKREKKRAWVDAYNLIVCLWRSPDRDKLTLYWGNVVFWARTRVIGTLNALKCEDKKLSVSKRAQRS